MAISECRLNDIKIYRGTQEEIKSLPTVNMAIYLVHDKNMLLVGNNTGKKIPYGNIPELIKKEVDALLFDFFNSSGFEAKLEARIGTITDEKVEEVLRAEILEEILEDVFSPLNEAKNDAKVALEIARATEGEFNSLKENFSNLSNNVNEKINDIQRKISDNNNTLNEKIDASVDVLSEKIEDLKNNINIDIDISNYYVREEVDKLVIQHMTGDAINSTPAPMMLRSAGNERGSVILCTEDSSDGTLSTGTLLYEKNGTISKIGYTKEAARTDIDEIIKDKIKNFYTKNETDELIGGLASKAWVSEQGFIKEHQSLDNYYTKGETENLIDEKINDIAIEGVDLTDYYTKAETEGLVILEISKGNFASKDDIETIRGEIPSINGLANTEWVEENFATKKEIENIVVPSTGINYMTGDEIVQYILGLEDIKDFKPVFCTLNSKDSMYDAGVFYYYDVELEEITAVSTGGSITPETITSTLKLVLSRESAEISSTPIDLVIESSIDKLDAVAGEITLKYLNSSKIVDLSEGKTDETSISIPGETTGSYSFSLSANKKAATKKYTYVVNNSSKTFTVYQPHIFQIVSPDSTIKTVERGKSIKKAYTNIETKDGDIFEIVVPVGTSIYATSGPIEFPFTKTTEERDINGIKISCDIFRSDELLDDSINIVIS